MNGKLPAKSGKDAIKTFGRLGFVLLRIKGDHHTLAKGSLKITVPLRLKKGTLRGIIKDSGVSVEEFLKHDP